MSGRIPLIQHTALALSLSVEERSYLTRYDQSAGHVLLKDTSNLVRDLPYFYIILSLPSFLYDYVLLISIFPPWSILKAVV